jgi:two-component system response regulator FixJ
MPVDSVVHVVDDDHAALEALQFLLESAGFQTRTYNSAVKFLGRVSEVERGCVITDVRMPEMSGIEMLRRLQSIPNKLPVIVITGHGDITIAVEAMKLGAVDFLEKPYDDEALVSAIRAALTRSEDEAKRGEQIAEIKRRMAELSQRERQVLDGLIAGQPNKNIAADLQISPRTVEIYRANVMTKMKASSLSELVRMSMLADTGATEAKR